MDRAPGAPYKSELRTTDLTPATRLRLGSGMHCAFLDLIAAIENDTEDDIIRLLHGGRSQESIAEVLGISQPSVSRRLRALAARAA